MSFETCRGIVYLDKDTHTAMCVRNDGAADLLAEFSISETGNIDGAPSDQTGRESRVRSFYAERWNDILHYNGKANGGDSVSRGDADGDIEFTERKLMR